MENHASFYGGGPKSFYSKGKFYGAGDTETLSKIDIESVKIASFNTNIQKPLKSLIVDIEPIQDLHGYEAPWPAGGGKNLLNPENFLAGWYLDSSGQGKAGNTNVTYTEYILLEAEKAYTISCNSSMSNIGVCLYSSNKSTVLSRYNNYNSTSVTIPANSSVRYARFWFDIDGKAMTVARLEGKQPQFELGSVATSYAPYSNICPITGWTGAKIMHSKENLFNSSDATLGYRLSLTGQPYQETGAFICTPITVEVGETYMKTSPIVDAYHRFCTYDVNMTFLRKVDDSNTITIQEGQAYLKFCGYQSEFATTMLVQANTYNITFPSEAGAVYGGTLDVMSGVLTVDRVNIASYAGETLPGEWISDRDVYALGTSPTNGAQVVYKLTTPVTYHLTPTEIETLLGENNVWADTGDIEKLTYLIKK